MISLWARSCRTPSPRSTMMRPRRSGRMLYTLSSCTHRCPGNVPSCRINHRGVSLKPMHCMILRSISYSPVRVKADSLFSYQPPINLIALCIMYPASYILTPRWFHKVCTRTAVGESLAYATLLGQCVYDQAHKLPDPHLYRHL